MVYKSSQSENRVTVQNQESGKRAVSHGDEREEDELEVARQ